MRYQPLPVIIYSLTHLPTHLLAHSLAAVFFTKTKRGKDNDDHYAVDPTKINDGAGTHSLTHLLTHSPTYSLT